MRENRKSGLKRGSNGIGNSRPLLSTLLVNPFLVPDEGPAVASEFSVVKLPMCAEGIL